MTSQVLNWIIFGSTLLALIGDPTVLGYKLTGWGWVIPLWACTLVLLRRSQRVSFPLRIWAPWLLLVAGYFVFSPQEAAQRSIQMTTPIVVGLAASTMRPAPRQVEALLRLAKWLAAALWVVVLSKTAVYLTRQLPGWLPLPAEVMSGMLLACVFASAFVLGRRREIVFWLSMLAVPLFAVTRTAIVATVVTLPLTLAPMTRKARVGLLALVMGIGLWIFLLPRVQAKMFHSGSGSITDARTEDLQTNGRLYMWQAFAEGITEKPVFGHGAGAGEKFTRLITQGELSYPHNDWLLTAYDYGLLGVCLYALTLIFAVTHARRQVRYADEPSRILLIASASAFIPYALMMMTDNIMVYSSFFGNLQMYFLGVAYGAVAAARSGVARARMANHANPSYA